MIELTNRSTHTCTLDAAPPELEVTDLHGRSVGTSGRPRCSYLAVPVPGGSSVTFELSVWLPRGAEAGEYRVRFHLTEADTGAQSPTLTVDVGYMSYIDGLSSASDTIEVHVSPLEPAGSAPDL